MLRVITFNANGIRSAADKGFWDWFDRQEADLLCVQELKAQEADLGAAPFERAGYRRWLHCAVKKGYSGCAIWSRHRPTRALLGLDDPEFDPEGRCVRLDFGRLSLLSAYFPSGTSGDERQAAKYRFLALMEKRLTELRGSGQETLLCGDLNIAHKPIDLKNWRANQDHSGFLPEERAWLSHVFDDLGWVDVFRRLDPRPERYTWWSQRGQARAKNVGWRIDYQIATPELASRARASAIHNEDRFSDHAPLIIDYDWTP